MFVWEVRDDEHRLLAYFFEKQLAMDLAHLVGGTWRALEHAPIESLLLKA